MNTAEILQVAEEFETLDKFAIAVNAALIETGSIKTIHANMFRKWSKDGGANSRTLELISPVMPRVREIGLMWKNAVKAKKPKANPPAAPRKPASKKKPLGNSASARPN